MTREEAIKLLEAEQAIYDMELSHTNADKILCDFLEALGYGDVVEAWRKVGKWYA